MRTQYVSRWQDNNLLNSIVRSAALGYRKHKIAVQACTSCTLHDTQWGGGTKLSYSVLNVTPGAVAINVRYPAGGEGSVHEINDTTVMVSHGTFCGKTATVYVYATQAVVDKLIAAGGNWEQAA